jgi:hypothetical protein
LETTGPTTFDGYLVDFFSEHARAGTRWSHFAGMHLGVVIGVAGLVKRNPAMVAGAAAISSLLDVGSHYVFENGYPGKSLTRPLWSVRANLVMCAALYRGGNAAVDRRASDAIAASRETDRSVGNVTAREPARAGGVATA